MFDLSEIDITTRWHPLYGLWQKVTYWVKNVVYQITKNVYLHVTQEMKKEASQKFAELMRSLR